ncbi:TonB-dependent receptor [Marinigracilibium pacificum]|uniref:TonB-dependent receptor n=1 Tax=Marinigracilibium pacificum TaxID=2729599 RepID=A0A848IVG6_9BACT|nr:TonB-dependent receptor [Marinigracilibium pacificum]NMM47275.1 TonB-dependent receptor [Marinigracilibium pacificum]
MKNKLLILCLFIATGLQPLLAQYTVSGKVVDKEDGQGMVGVNVIIQNTTTGVVTEPDGTFAIKVSDDNDVSLMFTFIGYETFTKNVNGGSDTNIGTISMTQSIQQMNEVVVSVTRKPEKITEAPASISVIDSDDLDLMPTYNVGEFLNKVQGIEVVRSGVLGVGINARGFNSAFNVRMLQLNDGRNGMLPGGTGLPAGVYNTIIKEDIERMEVIVGPASALYGPNAHAGVVNTITKDPRSSEGTTLVLGGGNQSQFSVRGRHAQVIGESPLSFKVNFEYTKGKDFEFIDTVYTPTAGAQPELDPDFDFEILRYNAALYYELNNSTDIILDYGYGEGSNIGVTNLGRNQIDGWNFKYLNARLVSDHWYATVYNTWNDAGYTYQINGRTNNYHALLAGGETEAEAKRKSLLPVEEGGLGFPGFVDKSQRFNAEVQYNNTFGDDFYFVVGANYQRDVADSEGTYLYDTDGPIKISQYGAVVQLEKPIGDIFKFVGAARVDKHEYYDLQFSPRLAMTAKAGRGNFRLTYSRAYAAPSIQYMQFLFPFAGGAIIGSGEGLTTVEFTQSLIDGSVVYGEERTIDPLKPEKVNTFEFGYKGLLGDKLAVDFTSWYSKSRDFLSPAVRLFSVNVADLNITGEQIIKKGDTEIPAEYGNLHITYLNYGEVSSYGSDIGLTYFINNNFSVAAKYMYFNSDITDEEKFEDDPALESLTPETRASLRTLNAPNHRASFNFSAVNLLNNKLSASLNIRIVPEYDFISGQQKATADGAGTREPGFLYNYGPLGGFTTVDVSAGYKISNTFQFGASVTNLFNTEQREFVGSPMIGRLFNAELKINLDWKKD